MLGEPVVDHPCDLRPVLVELRLAFDHARDDQRLIGRHAELGRVRPVERRGLYLELVDEQVDGLAGRDPLFQVVRLGEEHPFQVLRALRQDARRVSAARAFGEKIRRGDAGVLLEDLGDLADGLSLGERNAGELDLRPLLEDRHHVPVTHVRAEDVLSGLEILRAPVDARVESEQPRRFDDAGFLEPVGDRRRRRARLDDDGNLVPGLRPARGLHDVAAERAEGDEQHQEEDHELAERGYPRPALRGRGSQLLIDRGTVFDRHVVSESARCASR